MGKGKDIVPKIKKDISRFLTSEEGKILKKDVVKAAAVLGIVGAGGIGAVLSNTLAYRRFDKAGMAIIVVVLATIAVDYISGTIRRRIIEGTGAKRIVGDDLEQPELAESPT